MESSVRVAVASSSVGIEGLALATAEGLSLWEGLPVQFVEISRASCSGCEAAAAALLDGTVDVAYMSDVTAARCFAEGYAVKVLCSTMRLPARCLVGRRDVVAGRQHLQEARWAIEG